jgi:hypothetical protein
MSWVATGVLREELEEERFDVPHPASTRAQITSREAPTIRFLVLDIMVRSIARFHGVRSR